MKANPRSAGGKSKITLCLIHSGAQPGAIVAEPVQFGLQDTKGEIHAATGTTSEGKSLFAFPVEVKLGSPGENSIFIGPYCHGSPSSRFVYLSWKRIGEHASPWAWRIKVPLGEISWEMISEAEKPNYCLEADVSELKPHAKVVVFWRVVRC